MARRRRALRALGALVAGAALVTASCGGGGGANSTSVTADPAAPQADRPQAAPVRIRLALAPDPVWEWLKGSGTVAGWEASRNIRIEASSPFDQFSAFAGGHADVVVINALDVPQFVEQSDREPTIIGKYTTDRSILAVKRTSRAEDFNDLVEARIAVESSLGSTLLWGLIAKSLHDLEFRVDGPDFELVVVDPASVADLVMRGDVDACICVPDFSVSYLADGTMKVLYGGRSAAEIYAEDVVGDPDALPIADAFLIDRSWHHSNEAAAAALLELWEVGVQHWKTARPTVIASYPHLFSVTTDAEVAWITDYAGTNDWIVSSVFVSEDEAEAHEAIFDEMRRVGLVDAHATMPDVDTVHSEDAGTGDEPGSGTGDEPAAGSGGDDHSAGSPIPQPQEQARG